MPSAAFADASRRPALSVQLGSQLSLAGWCPVVTAPGHTVSVKQPEHAAFAEARGPHQRGGGCAGLVVGDELRDALWSEPFLGALTWREVRPCDGSSGGSFRQATAAASRSDAIRSW